MDAAIRTHMDNIYTTDRDAQNAAYDALMRASDEHVDWAYEVWDEVPAGLKHKDNHVRAIAGQLLSGLAKSDPEGRILKYFPVLLEATKDERFVTARHIMQSLWKVGAAGEAQRKVYLDGMKARFAECAAEKNYTLIRFDISESLRKVYDLVHDEAIRETALALIETESDEKYRKKYAAVWKKK